MYPKDLKDVLYILHSWARGGRLATTISLSEPTQNPRLTNINFYISLKIKLFSLNLDTKKLYQYSRVVLVIFPKTFSQERLSKRQFPKWQLPKYTISLAATSQRLSYSLQWRAKHKCSLMVPPPFRHEAVGRFAIHCLGGADDYPPPWVRYSMILCNNIMYTKILLKYRFHLPQFSGSHCITF